MADGEPEAEKVPRPVEVTVPVMVVSAFVAEARDVAVEE